jgi:hypothetical protein
LAEFGSVSNLTAGQSGGEYPIPAWLCEIPGEGGLS